MIKKEVIQMAYEVGLQAARDFFYRGSFERMTAPEQEELKKVLQFAALIADAEAKKFEEKGFVTVGHMHERIAAEREACANICKERAKQLSKRAFLEEKEHGDFEAAITLRSAATRVYYCADEIEARGTE